MAKTRKPTREQMRQKVRKELDSAKKQLDFSAYQERHPDKVFRVFNNEAGRVEKMMRLGWEPVEAENGNTSGVWSPDKKDADKSSSISTYVQVPLGVGRTRDSIDGVLMCIDKEIFAEIEEIKKEPLRQINQQLVSGKPLSGDHLSEEDSGMATYAPNLGDGNQGLSVQKSDRLV